MQLLCAPIFAGGEEGMLHFTCLHTLVGYVPLFFCINTQPSDGVVHSLCGSLMPWLKKSLTARLALLVLSLVPGK